MTKKPVCLRFGSTAMNFKTDEEFWKNFTNLAREIHGHGGVTKVMQDLAVEWFAKYEGKSGNIDQFLDQNFIPKPDLTDSVEDKVKWLKTQNKDLIHKLMDDSHRTWIMCQALLDCPDIKNFDMNYMEAWQRYK